MKQIVQSFKSGELQVLEVPSPNLRARGVLVRTRASLISSGTERMVTEFAEKNLLQKAQARPDLVRQVIDKVQREGLVNAYAGVQNKLEQSLALGYSSSGIVVEVGSQAGELKIGDRVACSGGGFASHAELVFVPRNLLAKLPSNVDFEVGCFATVGAISLQGVRQAEAVVGHKVAVIGLGLLGQLAVQILRAAGCQVFGIDLNPERVAQALLLGAHDGCTNAEVNAAHEFSKGRGFDSVIITADTKSNEPVALAGELARDRGIVVAVGAVGMEIPRKVYYEKELDFRLSRSYGAGRYDPGYEEQGNDYPYGYVRWTEQRNVESFLELVCDGQVNVEPLITHRFPIDQAQEAYSVIQGKSANPFTGVVLQYPGDAPLPQKIVREAGPSTAPINHERMNLGVVGAGNFATATLLPILKNMAGVHLTGVSSANGLSGRAASDRFGFEFCASDIDQILNSPNINTAVVVTRHDLHAGQCIAAFRAGKDVFVEKPLALNEDELGAVLAAREAASADHKRELRLMVGFNRRFAHFVRELKKNTDPIREPLMINVRVNAGYIPIGHWVHDPDVGGGRLVGEGCHFIDLMIFLAGANPLRARTISLPNHGKYQDDNLQVTLEFENGSIGNFTYVANGSKAYPKEAIEVFGGGLAARIDDYRSLHIDGKSRVRQSARFKTEKGHRAEWEAFVAHSLKGAPAPISLEEIVVSHRTTFAAQQSLKTGNTVEIEN